MSEAFMKIGLTSVFVHNPHEALEFYTQVLGFVTRLYVPEAALAIIASSEEPDGTGLLLEPNDNSLAKTYQEAIYQSWLPEIVFVVKDIG
jgi:hypothetical protein